MREKVFRFKQFSVLNDKTAMKVGTDGVLLGAWCCVDGAASVLDVGTGCGVIALMIAQRNGHCRICGIDIDADAISEATHNFENSPWAERLRAECADYLSMPAGSNEFDLIVSNPPFFVNGVKSPDEARMKSRHVDVLPVGKLMEKAASMLKENGKFCFIYPADNDAIVEELVAFSKFNVCRKVHVVTLPGAKPKRTLWELVLGRTDAECSVLSIENENHEFSEEYVGLTKNFYLKM